MKTIKSRQAQVDVAPDEFGREPDTVGICPEPPTRSQRVPISRPATPVTVSGSSLSRPRKKIYIVEDQPVFRDGLLQILNSEEDLMVCGMAAAVDQAIPAIVRTQPDLVLVDISFPGNSGLELIKELRSVAHSAKLLVISMYDEALYAAKVLRSGGDGFLVKQEDPDEIVCAIHDVLEGHIYVSEEVMENNRNKGRSRSNGRATSPAESSNGCRA
jgi:DNA-binding NarL/FixJ family response regulator